MIANQVQEFQGLYDTKKEILWKDTLSEDINNSQIEILPSISTIDTKKGNTIVCLDDNQKLYSSFIVSNDIQNGIDKSTVSHYKDTQTLTVLQYNKKDDEPLLPSIKLDDAILDQNAINSMDSSKFYFILFNYIYIYIHICIIKYIQKKMTMKYQDRKYNQIATIYIQILTKVHQQQNLRVYHLHQILILQKVTKNIMMTMMIQTDGIIMQQQKRTI